MLFRIDFLHPGRAFPKDTALFRFKKKASIFVSKFWQKLVMDVASSITTLVVGAALILAGFVFFYEAIYLPRQRDLERNAEEIKRLEAVVRKMRKEKQAREAKRRMIKERIEQLMNLRQETITWADKLRAINRSLVKGVWLTSLEVKGGRPPKPKVSEQKEKKRHHKTKKKKVGKKEEQREQAVQGGGGGRLIGVVLRGATYADAEEKPLKLIAKFMENLMDDPVWQKSFDLKDWVINTEPVGKNEEEGRKGIITFRLELERKK